MKHVLKWLLPVLVLAEIVLLRLRLIDLATAIVVVVAIETLLFLVALRQVVTAVRVYRRDRNAGLDAWTALENGLEIFMPRTVARVLALEPRIWYCLVRWLLRRQPTGTDVFSYHRKSSLGAFLVLLLFTTPAEVLLIELLLPWAWLRWTLLVFAVYAFVWAFGFYASLAVEAHLLGPGKARFRYGIFAHAEVPYDEIAGVRLERVGAPGWGDGLKLAGSTAFFAVGGNTEVVIRLKGSRPVEGWLSPTAPVSTIRVSADEPERLVELLLERAPVARDASTSGA